MSKTIIRIDLDALDRRLANGCLWTNGWGDWATEGKPTCLHGAIRYCQPVPGDAHIIQQVGDQFGFGIGDNDDADSWQKIRALVRPDITDDMLAETFGSQWEAIVALVRRAAVLTANEAEQLVAARHAARDAASAAAGDAAWDAAWAVASTAARHAARDAAGDAARTAAWVAARHAAWVAAVALVVRDLIGQHGFTQEHYDLLTRSWREVIGPVHPDDAPIN